MSRPMVLFSIALVVAPVLTYLIYRLAKGLGYLEPPATKEQEYRRTVSASLYAFLLFLPVFIYGYEKGWPRIWVIFAAVNGIVLFLFAIIGSRTAVRLWKLRHPESAADREARSNPPEHPS